MNVLLFIEMISGTELAIVIGLDPVLVPSWTDCTGLSGVKVFLKRLQVMNRFALWNLTPIPDDKIRSLHWSSRVAALLSFVQHLSQSKAEQKVNPLISCELQTLSADQKQKRFRKHFSMNQCASSPWFSPTIYSGPTAALTHCMIYHWEPALVCWVAAFMPGGTVVPTTTRRGPQRCTQIKPQHKLTLCAWKPPAQ